MSVNYNLNSVLTSVQNAQASAIEHLKVLRERKQQGVVMLPEEIELIEKLEKFEKDNGLYLQHGKSLTATWPGGDLVVAIVGNFITASGTSTVVDLHFSSRRADGVLDSPKVVRTFSAPGEQRFNLPPGEFSFLAYGPAEAEWHIEVQASPAAPPPKVLTTEQRLAALEQAQRAPLEVAAPTLVQ